VFDGIAKLNSEDEAFGDREGNNVDPLWISEAKTEGYRNCEWTDETCVLKCEHEDVMRVPSR